MKNTKLINLIKNWPFEDKEKELWSELITYLPDKFTSYFQSLLEERQKDLAKLEKINIEKLKRTVNV